MPFAAYDPDLQVFSGYFYELCTDAVTRAGYSFVLESVDQHERHRLLTGNSGRKIHLLCDPTTVTLARLRQLLDQPFSFSPVLFIASSARYENNQAERVPSDDTACKPIDVPNPGPTKYAIGYVAATTGADNLRRVAAAVTPDLSKEATVCGRAFDTYAELASAFCAEDSDLRWIIGDTEIVRHAMNRLSRDCKYTSLVQISAEPYALIIADEPVALRDKVIFALYQLIAEGLARSKLEIYFDTDRGLSRHLDSLLWINSVPRGDFD
jgi:hypothetical protein